MPMSASILPLVPDRRNGFVPEDEAGAGWLHRTAVARRSRWHEPVRRAGKR
jgi:hypothetical protein